MTRSVHVKLAGHHDNPPRFHQRIEATLTHTADDALQVGYAVHGLNLDLRVPTPHAPAPADALWKTTCFELFLGTVGQAGYREFNFATSGQWASYDFSDTRQRSAAPASTALDCPAPHLACERSEDLLTLTATLPKQALPNWRNAGATLRIAVSAVLEANDGRLAYWALAHPAGKPDFHHPAGFLLGLVGHSFTPLRPQGV